MIESLVFQRPLRLLQQYEFTLNWLPKDVDGVAEPYYAIVTVSHEDGVTTIIDISIEGDLPDNFQKDWDPAKAIKMIEFELTEELKRISQN